jgi:GGDEF domain-containing protein
MRHVWSHRDDDAEYRALFHNGLWLVKPPLLRDRLEVALARAQRVNKRVVVLFVTVDVPDDYTSGRGRSIDLLPLIAGRLRSAVRPDDTVGAVGPFDFVVICNDVTEDDDLERIAARLEAVVTARVFPSEEQPDLSARVTGRIARPRDRAIDLLKP